MCLIASSRGQDARDREEARLHDGVDARAHAGTLGELVGVDREKAELLLDDLLLHLRRQVIPHLVRGERRVQQKRGARRRVFEDVDLVDELELMTGDEAGAVHQVRGSDRLLARAQMRDGDRAGFLRVVDEVALREELGFLADDLDRVLVGADRAVRAEPVEQRRRHIVGLGRERRIPRQRQVRHVVDDADGEVVLGLVLRDVVEDALDHRGRELLRRQPVAAGDQARRHGERRDALRVRFGERRRDVEIERVARRARLLRPIQDGERADGLRQRGEERLLVRTGDRAGPSARRPSRREPSGSRRFRARCRRPIP